MSEESAAPTGKKTRVLVVEDDRFLQKILLMKFESEGFVTVGASDGEEGLRLARTDKPDLIVLDLILPKVNGFEVPTELKTEAATKAIPVVVLSNLGQDEDIRRVLELGALDFLVKSNHSIMEVVSKVKEAYAKHLRGGK